MMDACMPSLTKPLREPIVYPVLDFVTRCSSRTLTILLRNYFELELLVGSLVRQMAFNLSFESQLILAGILSLYPTYGTPILTLIGRLQKSVLESRGKILLRRIAVSQSPIHLGRYMELCREINRNEL